MKLVYFPQLCDGDNIYNHTHRKVFKEIPLFVYKEMTIWMKHAGRLIDSVKMTTDMYNNSRIVTQLDLSFNTLRPKQNGRHFPDDIFKCIFFNENVWISLKISLRFVPN